jgi:hypothetical protein
LVFPSVLDPLRYMTEIARLHVYPFELIFALLQSLNDSREWKKTLVVRMTVNRDGDRCL